MNVSPLDLRQQRFRKSLRGFDPVEVTSFLGAVADDYEAALRETDRLRQEVARLDALLSEHRDHEKNLRNTLLTAQKVSDDIRAGAEEDARRIVHDAESRASLMLEKTQGRLEDLQRDIDTLRLKRRDVQNSLESTIAALRTTVEFVHEQEARDREDKVLLHRPRLAELPAPTIDAEIEEIEPRRAQSAS